jgi:hypothetical protein
MNSLTRTLLVVLYPLLVLSWFVNRLLGRDHLQLLNPPAETSCWIARHSQPNTESYFSESSCCEPGDAPSAALPVILLLRNIARLYAPPREKPDAQTIYDREQPIPDEVYTLW